MADFVSSVPYCVVELPFYVACNSGVRPHGNGRTNSGAAPTAHNAKGNATTHTPMPPCAQARALVLFPA